MRVYPFLCKTVPNIFSAIFDEEGFHHHESDSSGRTFILDLSFSLEDLHRGLGKKWRKSLGRAQSNGLQIIDGTDTELLHKAINIYHEMHKRKRFSGQIDMLKYMDIQEALPDGFKMHIFLAFENSEITSALVWSAIGAYGLPILAATADEGLKNASSYLLHWKLLEWLKSRGYRYFDLGGINPDRNWGGYQFKRGLAGKHGQDMTLLGKFDCYRFASFESVISVLLLRLADTLKALKLKAGQMFRKSGINKIKVHE